MSASNTYNSNGKKVSVNEQIEVVQHEKHTDTPHPDLNDEEVVQKALDEVGEEFLQLWTGDLSPVEGDQEAAEKALLEILIYYSTWDSDQVVRLGKQSDLMADSWDEGGGDMFENKISELVYKLTDYDRDVYPDGEPPEILSPEERTENEQYTSQKGNLIPNDIDVVIHNGKYQTVRWIDDDEKEYDEVANFTLDVNSFLVKKDGTKKFDMDVRPASPREDTYSVVVDARVFNEIRDFKDEVCTGTTVAYKGSSRELSDIKKRVGNQEAPVRNGVTTVGLHDDEMVTPNGIVDDEWKVENPENSFVPRKQAIEEKWDLEIEDSGEYNEEEVANIVETLWQTRDPERFLPILGYWYSSLLAPKIRDQDGELPMATIMGNTGVGKSGTLRNMYKLIGMDGANYSARDTKFGLMNALSSTNNIPIWLDEYKPSDMKKYEIDILQDFLRKVTKKGDETRGNSDQTITTYTLEAPVVLAGEESIQGSAEERRSIRTQFRGYVTEESPYTEHFAKLEGGSYQTEDGLKYTTGYDLHEHAKAIWKFILSIDDDEFQNQWRDAKETVFEILETHEIVGISGLELTSLTMIQYGVDLYNKFGKQNGAKELPTQDDIEKAILYIAHQMGQSNRSSHVGEFVELVADAIEAGYLVREDEYEDETGDFTLVHKNKENEQLRLKLQKAHHAVSKYVNDHNLHGVDLLDDYKDYRKRMKDDVDYIPETSQVTVGLGRCVSINTHLAEEVIDGFERGKIAPEVYYDVED